MDNYHRDNVDLKKYNWIRNVFNVNVNEARKDILDFQEEFINRLLRKSNGDNNLQQHLPVNKASQVFLIIKTKPINRLDS